MTHNDVFTYISYFIDIKLDKIENELKKIYIGLPVIEKFYYVKPFIAAFYVLEKGDTNIVRRNSHKLKNLLDSVNEVVSNIELKLENCNDETIRRFVAFQVALLQWIADDAVRVTKSSNLVATVEMELRDGVSSVRKPHSESFRKLYLGAHMLEIIRVASERPVGRLFATVNALISLTETQVMGTVPRAIWEEFKKVYNKKGGDMFSLWHQRFLVFLGGPNLITTYELKNLEEPALATILENNFDRLKQALHGSVARQRPPKQVDILATSLGVVVSRYWAQNRENIADKVNEREFLALYCKYAKFLTSLEKKPIEIARREDIKNMAEDLGVPEFYVKSDVTHYILGRIDSVPEVLKLYMLDYIY